MFFLKEQHKDIFRWYAVKTDGQNLPVKIECSCSAISDLQK